jgi:hypothetical protein
MRSFVCGGLLALLGLVLIIQHQPPNIASFQTQSPKLPASVDLDGNHRTAPERTVLPPNEASSESHGLDLARELDQADDSDILFQLTSTLTESGLKVLLNSLAPASNDETDIELGRLLLRRWAEINPASAAAWAGSLPEGPFRFEVMGHVAIVWANTDLAGALHWVRQLPEGESRNSACLNLGYEAARTEPLISLELALQLPARTRDELLAHAAGEWASRDPLAAAEWASRISETGLRGRILCSVATGWADLDPRAAATWAVMVLPAGELQDRGVTAIVQRWVQQSPKSAGEWVQQFPPSPLRGVALQSLISIWANADPISAAQWLAALPVGQFKVQGMEAMRPD